MKPLKDVFIPKNYADALPELKGKYFTWQMHFSSRTDLGTIGQITHYSVGDVARGNFVLVPGLASNTQIEPLMGALSYWSLKHKYNIYALDTFLGNFKPEISAELAKKNTFPEFIDLMDAGLEIVSKMSMGKWTCVVGHSLGGTGVLEVFNRRVLQNRPVGFSGAILFAPYVTKEWFDFSKKFMHHHQYPDLSDDEFEKVPMGLMSPHDVMLVRQNRYVSLFTKFYDEVVALQPRPDLMAQYNIPVTMVAGGKDQKSPIEYIRSIYNQVNEYSPKEKMRFVEFPESRHSFMHQHEDWVAILRVMRSQYVQAAKNQK
ncbi:MAG: alpha/beta hydrolase [Alphaproteobacteria bacterium]|nr:alpha/beta hydrolase [Alphaproteobacteria bacterium]